MGSLRTSFCWWLSVLRFRKRSAAIVTACDEAFAPLMFGLVESLGRWRRFLYVIDIGLTDGTRREARRRGIKILSLPSDFFRNATLFAPYMRAMYVRPSLPELVDAELILWIDSDCWVQRLDAIEKYFDGADRFPLLFTICTMMDVDYGRCVKNYPAYHDGYYKINKALFGEEVADLLYGNAIFSSGVFAADRSAPVWKQWRNEVTQLYEENELVKTDYALAHMAEQQALNKVLHRAVGYNCLTSEFNWHCHCSEVVRTGSTVRIMPSGRVPSIVHLADFRSHGEDYRRRHLLYARRSHLADGVAAALMKCRLLLGYRRA
jgi:hypothetical protein